MSMRSRPRKGKAKKPVPEKQRVERLYRNLLVEKRIYKRWVTGSPTTIAAGGGGVIALSTVANAASVSASPDFASIAALYTAYRVAAIRATVMAMVPVPFYTGVAVQTRPPVIAFWPWTTNTVATTFAQACDSTGVVLKSGYQTFVLANSYKGDPDAHLWTSTGSAIGSNEQFGISCIGDTPAGTASIDVYRVIPQYLVEFRMNG